MAFTYDINTPRGQVRLLIGDTTEEGAVFADDEIDFFLELESNVVDLAAARALEAIAADKARTAIMLKTLNWTKDTRALPAALIAAAKELRELEASRPCYGSAEVAYTPMNAAQIIINKRLRGQG